MISVLRPNIQGKISRQLYCVDYYFLYNELCKTRVLIGLEECVIRV